MRVLSCLHPLSNPACCPHHPPTLCSIGAQYEPGEEGPGSAQVLYQYLRPYDPAWPTNYLVLAASATSLALAGAYVPLEATLTGSRALLVATSAAGLLAAALLCRLPHPCSGASGGAAGGRQPL